LAPEKRAWFTLSAWRGGDNVMSELFEAGVIFKRFRFEPKGFLT